MDKKNGKMVFPVRCINSYALGQELAYNAEERVWANPFLPPLIIIDLYKPKEVRVPAWHLSPGLWHGNRRHLVREPGSRTTCWDSRVARFTRTVAREPATYSAGTRFPHDMLRFPFGTFHKDCGAGTGDI